MSTQASGPAPGAEREQEALLVQRLQRLGFSDAQIRALLVAPLDDFPRLYGVHAARLRRRGEDRQTQARQVEAAAVVAHLSTVRAACGAPVDATDLHSALAEQTTDALLVVHRDSRRYWLANAAAEQLLGYTRGDLLSMNPLDITPPDDLPHLLGSMGALEEQGRWEGEWRFRHRAGGIVRTHATAERFVIRDQVLYHGQFRAVSGDHRMSGGRG